MRIPLEIRVMIIGLLKQMKVVMRSGVIFLVEPDQMHHMRLLKQAMVILYVTDWDCHGIPHDMESLPYLLLIVLWR